MEQATEQMRWYAIQTYTGRENAVMEALKSRVLTYGYQAFFGRMVIPTEDVVEMRNGRKCRSQRKFFPGYLFVNMVMNDDTWHLVRSLPWTGGFVSGSSDRPAPISDQDIGNILDRMRDGAGRPRPKTSFAPGEVVRIIDGPFADFEGVVDNVNYEKNRLTVSVSIFGRATPVDLEFTQVQKN